MNVYRRMAYYIKRGRAKYPQVKQAFNTYFADKDGEDSDTGTDVAEDVNTGTIASACALGFATLGGRRMGLWSSAVPEGLQCITATGTRTDCRREFFGSVDGFVMHLNDHHEMSIEGILDVLERLAGGPEVPDVLEQAEHVAANVAPVKEVEPVGAA